MSKEKSKVISSSMSLQEMEELLYSATNVEDLFKLQIELSKKLSSLHKYIHTLSISDEAKRNTVRQDISWATELKSVCEKRQGTLTNESNRFNRNFRLVAEKKLNRSLYDQICEEAKSQ